ncbi:Uncharacterized conserved protein [Listeria grayi]|uniref:PBSX phage terminase small subunit-like N-terminal domain-containing protein n=1 Tax=Listeria grayi FSL F6-1183 TaxID=1265827 RepID=A0A829RAG5_LISGR|nr:phage terminase small subunit [Listeria grayi]EUJ30106.1 hypothetical protein LMUR_03487 [Listeria grayi FSL F6-1183]VEI33788.1 Uncharacterized conserved protein [Listeria grayi]
MSRKRDPRRDEAKRFWLESRGEMKLVDIAEKLVCSAGQIRKWKSTDKWSLDDPIESVPKSNSSVTNEKERYQSLKGNSNAIGNTGGAPRGNKNAIGNVGGGAPVGNSNAVTTGEYESISWEFLTDEEQALYAGLDGNLLTSISRTIRELEIRKLNAETDEKYIVNGVLGPDTVFDKRFGRFDGQDNSTKNDGVTQEDIDLMASHVLDAYNQKVADSND